MVIYMFYFEFYFLTNSGIVNSKKLIDSDEKVKYSHEINTVTKNSLEHA